MKDKYQIIITLLSVWGIVVFFLLLYVNAKQSITISDQANKIVYLKNMNYINQQSLIELTNKYDGLLDSHIMVIQQRNFLNNEVARFHNRNQDSYSNLQIDSY